MDRNKIEESSDLKAILQSSVLRRILKASRAHQQEKINAAVSSQNWHSASYYLGRLRYIEKLGEIVAEEHKKLMEDKNG